MSEFAGLSAVLGVGVIVGLGVLAPLLISLCFPKRKPPP